MGKVYFKNRKINESISDQTLDDIVVECSPLYIEANRLGRSVDEKDYRNYVTNMQLKQRERLLNQIAEKINKFYGDDVLFVGYNNRDEYDEFVDLQPVNKHDNNFVRILTDALYSGISFTEAEKRHYDNVNRIISNNRNAEIEDNIRRYGKYDRAYYASGFGKVESPSKYSGKTLDTPKVLGKIELPKEDEKLTQRRNKFVRGVQESYDGYKTHKSRMNETSISTPRARYRSNGNYAFYKDSDKRDIIEMSDFAFAIARTVIKRSKHNHGYADLLEDILTDFTFSTAMHGAVLPDLSDTDKLEKDMGLTQCLVGHIIDNYK